MYVDSIPRMPDSLGDLIQAVSRQVRRGLAARLRPMGLTPAQARALRVVADAGPLRLGELAEHLHIAPRSTTDVVDQLEASGLVGRRPDREDRRAVVVAATEEGVRRIGLVEEARRDAADEIAQRLSATDRGELTRLLRKLSEEP